MSKHQIFDDIELSRKRARVAVEQSGARNALVSRKRIFGPTKGSPRTNVRKLLFAAVACGIPAVGAAAPAEGTSETTTRLGIPVQYSPVAPSIPDKMTFNNGIFGF